MRRKVEPVVRGVGRLRFTGHSGDVDYAIHGDAARLRLGVARLRGSISVDPELAQRAFQAGEAVLLLEGGEEVRLTMLGYSAGSRDVFFDVRF